jgi:hypothetical protein
MTAELRSQADLIRGRAREYMRIGTPIETKPESHDGIIQPRYGYAQSGKTTSPLFERVIGKVRVTGTSIT